MTKILLVEDDKSLREIYGVRLYAEGYDIVSAGDGEEALAMAIKERPQLIVSDVMMPKISGFDMLDILRSTTETKDIKVIMMTALSSEDQRARGEALGADRYLVKSQVGIEDVVRSVHEVLGDAPVSNPGVQTFGQNTQPAAPNPLSTRSATPTVPARPAPALPQQQPAPAAPQAAPAPQPSIQPPAPQPPQAFSPPAPVAGNTGLPRPTAPFSTNRPASLGDRVIHPITPEPSSKPDLASLMDQELNSAPTPAPFTPPPTPPTPPAAPAPQPSFAPPAPTPQPPVVPIEPAPQGAGAQSAPFAPTSAPSAPDPDISFEETPRPANPQPSGPQPPNMS